MQLSRFVICCWLQVTKYVEALIDCTKHISFRGVPRNLKEGPQFKAMPAGPDIFRKYISQWKYYFHCAKRTGSLKIITSVFRPKSREQQKKVFVFYTCSISPLHHENFVHLSAEGAPPLDTPLPLEH